MIDQIFFSFQAEQHGLDSSSFPNTNSDMAASHPLNHFNGMHNGPGVFFL